MWKGEQERETIFILLITLHQTASILRIPKSHFVVQNAINQAPYKQQITPCTLEVGEPRIKAGTGRSSVNLVEGASKSLRPLNEETSPSTEPKGLSYL